MDKYRPPESDSDEDGYDGFYFGDDDIKRPRPAWTRDNDQILYDAAVSGDFEAIQNHLSEEPESIDDPIRGGNTLLHHACQHGHLEIVKYLLDRDADPNRQVDSLTPLMSACSSSAEGPIAKEVVALLVDKGAVVNISNKLGLTPFMFACIHGQMEVVEYLVNIAFIEASDNQGWTAIFHAIENNQPEVVQILVNAGADVNASNRKGYQPRQVAQFHGFYDILDILPPEEELYTVPTNYLSYNTLRDLIPRLFLKPDIPEYFPDIDVILRKLRLQRFVENFAKHQITLYQFLTMTDDKLQEVDVNLPLHRKKILLGILRFHLEHWSIQSIAKVKRQGQDSFYDILILLANHIKNLTIINASLQYIQQNIKSSTLGTIDQTTINECRYVVIEYKKSIRMVQGIAKYLHSFSPKRPVLYINYDEIKAEEKKAAMRRYLKYSIMLGIAIVIVLKWKKFF